MGRLILDTGPLVAFLNARDRYHGWATATLEEVTDGLLTCEAVISEACFLLRNAPGGPEAVMTLVERGLVVPVFRVAGEAGAIRKLLGKYATVPMSLADACLVRLSEQNPGSVVLTLDGDFRVYRRNGRQAIPVMMPEGL